MTAVEIREPGPPQVLRAVERPVPEPGAGEVLIRVAAAAVDRPDVVQRKGLYPPPAGVTDIPALEVAGEVVGLGPDAREPQPGARVCAVGAGCHSGKGGGGLPGAQRGRRRAGGRDRADRNAGGHQGGARSAAANEEAPHDHRLDPAVATGAEQGPPRPRAAGERVAAVRLARSEARDRLALPAR